MCECVRGGVFLEVGRDGKGQLLSVDGLLGCGAGRRLSWAGSPVARTPGEGRGLDAQAMSPFPAENIRRTGATPGHARAAGGDLLRVALRPACPGQDACIPGTQHARPDAGD